jgi:hypothetical protein
MPTRTTVLLALALLVAGTGFIVRGPLRFIHNGLAWNDLTQAYVPARAWLEGKNPYDGQTFVDIWAEQTGTRYVDPRSQFAHATYPLTTLVVMSPFAVLSWKAALAAWTAIRLVLLLPMIWALARAGQLSPSGSLTLLAMTLALAPLHTGMATGNITVLALELAAIGTWAMTAQRPLPAGIAFGIVTCLKPQIGLCFFAYCLLRKRYRASFVCVATVCVVAAIGVVRLYALNTGWIHDFLHNAREFAVGHNVVNDFSASNRIRFTLINLHVPLYELTGSAQWTNLIASLTGFVMLVVWLRLAMRKQEGAPLLALGAVAILSLISIYHRFYDATLLVFPLCWSLAAPGCGLKIVRRIVWLAFIPFLLPGATILQQLESSHRISSSIAQSRWWNVVVMPHETWVLLVLALVLLYAMGKASQKVDGAALEVALPK